MLKKFCVLDQCALFYVVAREISFKEILLHFCIIWLTNWLLK